MIPLAVVGVSEAATGLYRIFKSSGLGLFDERDDSSLDSLASSGDGLSKSSALSSAAGMYNPCGVL
jgi:hypothetical protein